MQKITNFDELPIMLNPLQVGEVLGISRATAYNLFHSEGFPSVNIGTRLIVSKESLKQWIYDKEQEKLN